ncbi:carboxypeptidase N subunit 2-like [Dreissena polymorpha]|uniref:carboxypeptidase N subunit 2-like n=1 Tax=Dreissena polymorpha TaxID=45954 RepID=UPI0022643220|nr:carboxypeptidase N subunit 2-like [Dreissena polymorpha]
MAFAYFACLGLVLLITATTNVKSFLLDTVQVEPCQYTSSDVTCTSRGLNQVPVFNVSGGPCGYLFRVDVSNNAITRVNDDAFAAFQNCSNLIISLAVNNISHISDFAFRGIEGSTTHLNLSDNDFDTIPNAVGTLLKLSKLEMLNNPLVTFDPHVLANIGRTLNTLYISMGSLLHWPAELYFLRELKTLYISNMNFEHINTDAFQGLSKVQYLTIDHSQLLTVSSAVCQLTNLYILALKNNYNFHNSLNNVFDRCSTKKLNIGHLIFINNNVDFFPNIHAMIESVYGIHMENNNMQFMDKDTLSYDNRTNGISLAYNTFTRVPTGLYLFENLLYLTLSYNKITYVHDTDLAGLRMLRTLSLNGNPIRFITKNSFADNTILATIDLSNTLLTQIPEAVTSISSLNSLDLSELNIGCTCKMSNLKSWNITNVHFGQAKCYQTDELIEDFLESYIDTGRCTI